MKLFSLATSVFIAVVSFGGTSGLEASSALREVNPRQKVSVLAWERFAKMGSYEEEIIKAFGFRARRESKTCHTVFVPRARDSCSSKREQRSRPTVLSHKLAKEVGGFLIVMPALWLGSGQAPAGS
jgi:hypothetical protein